MFVVAAWLSASIACGQEGAAADRYDTPFGTVLPRHRPDGMLAPEAVKLQLWLGYPDARSTYRDHLSYAVSLQQRCRDQGLQVGVVMPTEPAAELAATRPALLVTSPARADEQANSNIIENLNGRVFLMRKGNLVAAMDTLDGIEDLVAAADDERRLRAAVSAKTRLATLVQGVPDGGRFGPQVASCLAVLPKSGRAHAAKVLFHWWCEGDPKAARAAAETALQQLAGYSLPLCTFADLVIRGDHEDRELAGLVGKALEPVAREDKLGAFSQLVYLRALLKSRSNARTAGRVAATLPKRLRDRPREQLFFAETLMDGDSPEVFRDTAERALKFAEADKDLKRWWYCTRHKILWRCGDKAAAEALMQAYRKDPVGQSDHNNDAWYLMVRPQTMGRFDSLALAQTRKMQEVQGARLSVNSKDTVALSLFRNGLLDEAIETQKQTSPQNNAAYMGRFQWYQATQAARNAAAGPKKANK